MTISSQDLDTTKVDWRGENMLPYGQYRPLPEEVVKQVQLLLAELDVVFATVDLIVTPEGEHIFLEVNPGGQFMWMQQDLRIDFAGCLARLLLAGGPFQRGDVRQVGY